MGFFDSLMSGVDRVISTVKESNSANSSKKEKESKEKSTSAGTAWGHTVTKNDSGSYTYTDSKGNKITTSFSPDEITRRNSGSGFDMFNPVLKAAADSRDVGLYTSYRGGNLQTTPQHDAGYISRDGGFGMDYMRRHMNPYEFATAYGSEMAGNNVNWDAAAWAGMYSPVPDIAKNLQDMYKQLGYTYTGNIPAQQQQQQPKPAPSLYQLPQIPEPWPGLFNQFNPYMYGGYGSYGGYGGYPYGGYGYYPSYPSYPTAPNGNGGINPGGSMYGGNGGTQTQNPNPNPTGGYDYSGINPGGMYGGMYGNMYGGFGGYGGIDPNFIFSLFGSSLFGNGYGY